MTPFECVGFPFRSDADYDDAVPDVLERMIPVAERLPCPAGFEGWSYRDPSGAGLLAYIEKDDAAGTRSLHCLKPAFYGGSRQSVTSGKLVEAEECAFCDVARVEVLDAAGTAAYPLVVRISDPYFRRFSWKVGVRLGMQATLLGMELDPWKREGTDSGRIRGLAEEAFLPSGTFRDPPIPEAVVSGRVVQSERRHNQLGGADFVWVRLASLASEYDLTVSTTLLPEAPAPGTILQVLARIYGRGLKRHASTPPG